MIQKKKTRTIPRARPKKKTKKEKSPEASVEEAPEELVEMSKEEEEEEEESDDDDADIIDVCKQSCILMQYSIILLGLFIIFLMQLIGMVVPQDFAESNTAAQLRAGAFQFYSTFFRGQKFCPCTANVTVEDLAGEEGPSTPPPPPPPLSSENAVD